MNDTYHYDEGAIHNDHKRVVYIDTISGDDLGKLLAAFFKDNAEDAVVVDEDDKQAKEQAKVLTENEEFMAIMERAVEQELCTQNDWQYKWANRGDGAYFASIASHKFHLSNRHDRDGDLAVSWKPFEALFDEKNLRSVFNDWQNGKYRHENEKKIEKLLR